MEGALASIYLAVGMYMSRELADRSVSILKNTAIQLIYIFNYDTFSLDLSAADHAAFFTVCMYMPPSEL